ncbi:MAG: nucleotide exchange factor GrpE [Nitrospira sp.]|nr:MAG: nucleotide exchange factor GrpE [Nitrospira sp.]
MVPPSEAGGKSKEGQATATEMLTRSLTAKDEEAKGFQDKYLRLAADFENYKRLSLREQRDASLFANERIIKDILPILDNLERAVRFAKENPDGNGLMQGVELTVKQFTETLSKFGVTSVVSIGEPFDPACHQAVTKLESNTAPDNTVVEEYQKGYRLHDRILRAAMVAVAAPRSASTDGEPTTEAPGS